MDASRVWPSPDAYQNAVLSPRRFLRDARLHAAHVESRFFLGSQRPNLRSGNFGAVYRFKGSQRSYALKVFYKADAERQQAISSSTSTWQVSLLRRISFPSVMTKMASRFIAAGIPRWSWTGPPAKRSISIYKNVVEKFATGCSANRLPTWWVNCKTVHGPWRFAAWQYFGASRGAAEASSITMACSCRA